MKTTRLPNSDIDVSVIAMGCWALAGDATWGEQDEAEAVAAVHAAIDRDITLFDTAEMYGNGLSEERLGAALKGHRKNVVVASKPAPGNDAPRDLIAACERSLRRLQTDYIDLYQLHWPSRDVPLDLTWEAMHKLRDQGKVRALGVCNFGVGDLGDLLQLDTPVTDQLPYNLLSRSIEYEILPRCLDANVGVLCYSPLLLGVLTGKFATADDVPVGRARLRQFRGDRAQARHGEAGCEQEMFAALDAIRGVAADLKTPMSDLAIAWLLAQPGVTSVLTGIRRPEQATLNTAPAELELPRDVLDYLDDVTEPVRQHLGANPDLWQGAGASRYR